MNRAAAAIALLLVACGDANEPSQRPMPVRSAHAAIQQHAADAALKRLSSSGAPAANDCADVSYLPDPPKTIARKCRRVLVAAARKTTDAGATSRFLEAARKLGATAAETADITDRLATFRRRARARTAHDDLSLFIANYGSPDEQDSTENDHPRPPIVTKWIVYRKEHVRATYLPDANFGDPPPYDRWKLIAFQDTRTNGVLRPTEVARRLRGRER